LKMDFTCVGDQGATRIRVRVDWAFSGPAGSARKSISEYRADGKVNVNRDGDRGGSGQDHYIATSPTLTTMRMSGDVEAKRTLLPAPFFLSFSAQNSG